MIINPNTPTNTHTHTPHMHAHTSTNMEKHTPNTNTYRVLEKKCTSYGAGAEGETPPERER